jgi:hypothetical protein
MNVILNATDLKCRHLVSAGDATDVGPNTVLDVGCYPSLAVFCGESEVVMKRGVGVGHGSLLSRRYATTIVGDSFSRPSKAGLNSPVATRPFLDTSIRRLIQSSLRDEVVD